MDFFITRSLTSSTCQLSTRKPNRGLENGSQVRLGPASANRKHRSRFADISKISRPNKKSRSCARIVLLQVFHQDDPSNRVPTYTALDDQSTDVFITDALLDQLRTEGQDVNLEINTILGANTVRTKTVNGLRIQDIEGQHQPMKIPHTYSREAIPASQSDIATPETAWEHLKKYAITYITGLTQKLEC